MKLHHIGIVVPKIQDSIAELKKFPFIHSVDDVETIYSQKVNICFLNIGNNIIELIEPINEISPIFNFSKNSGGFHHLCFEVEKLDKAIDEFEKKGARLIVKPVSGFENRLTAFVFLNTKNTNFNLIELAEKNV